MSERTWTVASLGVALCCASCAGEAEDPSIVGEVRGAPLYVPAEVPAPGAAGAVGAAGAAGAGAAGVAGASESASDAGLSVPSEGAESSDSLADDVGSSSPDAGDPEFDLGSDYTDLLSPEDAARYEWVDFSTLTDFEFPGFLRTDGEVSVPELPEEIVALDGRLIAIEGFMNPMMFDADGVSEFTLVADPQFCCFGATPQLNHFLYVTLADDERCEFYSIVPLAVYGRLEIGPEEEDGLVLSLYRLEADHVFCVY
jgi:hypothetical protein